MLFSCSIQLESQASYNEVKSDKSSEVWTKYCFILLQGLYTSQNNFVICKSKSQNSFATTYNELYN